MDRNACTVFGDSKMGLFAFGLYKVYSLVLHLMCDIANFHKLLIENTTIMNADVLPVQRDVFHIVISDWYSMWLPLVCKQSDKDCSVHRFHFWQSNFSVFFCLLRLYIKTTWSLVAEIMCTKYSFIHAHMQHTILKKKSYQQSLIFECSVCSACPLHEHFLAQSHVYIYIWVLLQCWS